MSNNAKGKIAVITGGSGGMALASAKRFVASKMPTAGVSLYSATKAALDAVSISLSKELGAKNIRVNSILPGTTETEVHVVRASLLAVRLKKCLLARHRLVAEVSAKILRKLPYFLLPIIVKT